MPLIPAAQYVRMSTESQQYSLHNQSAVIAEYASAHGFAIIQTYSDRARSGVVLKRRDGLKRLLSDIFDGAYDYQAILVQDVSRWGRFQDTDESAHYEFICRSAGVPVHYCAEPFSNNGDFASCLMKALKRSMAAEFSRELGVKVYQGKRRIAAAGFCVGGRTPYGFRRKIISDDVRRGRVLEVGERKNVRNERLTLVHGPAHEVACIREIFRSLVQDETSPRDIGRKLNAKGVMLRDRRWTKELVQYVLTNPVYAGFGVWGRSSQRLGSARTELASDRWVLRPKAFRPIIERSKFERAQRLLRPDAGRIFWTRERVVEAASQLLKQKGVLSLKLFDETLGVPSSTKLRQLGFSEICHSVGYELPPRFLAASRSIKATFQLHRELVSDFATRFPNELSILPQGSWTRLLLDDTNVVSLLICPTVPRPRGEARWRICPLPRDKENLTIICRTAPANASSHYFSVFPSIHLTVERHEFGESDRWLSTGFPLRQVGDLCRLLRIVARLRPPSRESRSSELLAKKSTLELQ